MKKPEFFIKALETLFWSFGSEPPAEVIWGANDMLEWMENEYQIEIKSEFKEDPAECSKAFEEVIAEIRSHFPSPDPVEPPVNL